MKLLTRAIVAAAAVSRGLAAQQTSPTSTPAPSARVVFVCEHGTVKSLVALEYFKRIARMKGLHIEAVSRGTNPDSLVPAAVRAGLTADGFDICSFRPQRFTRNDLTSGILVVALDAAVDSVVSGTVPIARWDGLPSVMADFRGARTAIAAKVRRLVDSLAAREPRGHP